MAGIRPVSYHCHPLSFVTDELLGKCSSLFNANYGVWSDQAPLHSNNALKAGERVKLGVKRLRENLLFNDLCFLITAEIATANNGRSELIGHAFCTSARYDKLDGNLVWVTQLVVSSSHRGHGVAGSLLSNAKNNVQDVVVIGIVSSHPHAVRALTNACNRSPIDLEFIGTHAKDVMEASNIPYLSRAELVGSIFSGQSLETEDKNQQPVSLVKTDFFVDHSEVLKITRVVRKVKTKVK